MAGTTALPQSTPLDKPAYTVLQLMDCLFWHVSPDAELWQEEHLASLVLCRVLNDMTDVRADAVTGEVSNFWLSSMSTHDKALYGACVLALIKYGCMPEAHGSLWNTWLMGTTVVWEGLTGRHALWFDGITNGLPPEDGCLLCGIEPDACAGLLTDGVALRTGPTPTVAALGPRAALLSAHCRAEHPEAWRLFDRELAAFEALHGEWRGDVGTTWAILRRTYVAGVLASLAGGESAREVQVGSGEVGAELFARCAGRRRGRRTRPCSPICSAAPIRTSCGTARASRRPWSPATGWTAERPQRGAPGTGRVARRRTAGRPGRPQRGARSADHLRSPPRPGSGMT